MRDRDRRKATDDCTDLSWSCQACGTLLAFIDKETKSQIRIKHKELFVWIDCPHSISITCRLCGAINKLIDIKPESPEPAEPVPA